MKDKMTARLFIITRFRDAYERNHITARNKKRGNWTPDGWIPNTFWNGYDKAGNDGMAEQRRLQREYPEYFESTKVQDLKKIYGKAFYPGEARIEAKRIKPEMRTMFSYMANAEQITWEEKK